MEQEGISMTRSGKATGAEGRLRSRMQQPVNVRPTIENVRISKPANGPSKFRSKIQRLAATWL